MKAFTTVTGIVVPMDRANVDTDQIIPKQFLKSIRRSGFQDNLFDGWRYLDEGQYGQNQNERQLNPDFVLNQERFQDAKIMLARENFGCGSSREHAVWALEEYGIRCLLSSSFADIFYNNCFKNSVLPIVLEKEIISYLFDKVHNTVGFSLTVDLQEECILLPDEERFEFTIDPFRKHSLMNGLNDIGLSLGHADAIRAYESKRKQEVPWLFADIPTGRSVKEDAR